MRRILYVFLVAVCLIAPTVAQDDDRIADLSGKAARVSRAGNDGRLTGPSNAQRPDIISAFLRGRHDEATASSLVLENENPTDLARSTCASGSSSPDSRCTGHM